MAYIFIALIFSCVMNYLRHLWTMVRISRSTTSQKCSVGSRSECHGRNQCHQTRQHFSSPLWFTVWSPAAVVDLLQGSTCCAYRNSPPHILVVTSGYLSYGCFPISSKQFDHSLRTSDINKAFLLCLKNP